MLPILKEYEATICVFVFVFCIAFSMHLQHNYDTGRTAVQQVKEEKQDEKITAKVMRMPDDKLNHALCAQWMRTPCK